MAASEHLGSGPDGGKLLGFLAAIGTLRVLTTEWATRRITMSWAWEGGWRPVWRVGPAASDEELIAALAGVLRARSTAPQFNQLGPDLPVSPEMFRCFAAETVRAATPEARDAADFAAAFGCDALTDGKHIQDTALRTMSGVGHQHFLAFMRKLAELTTPADLQRALFEPWGYQDEAPSMRWDPVDDRRYAHRADNPSGSKEEPIRTVRGANRLAVEGLPCFPTAPRQAFLATTGFRSHVPTRRRDRWAVRWPVWTPDIPLTVVRSLITCPDVFAEPVGGTRLRRLGVVEVFQARRITVGQARSFTPATAILGATPWQ